MVTDIDPQDLATRRRNGDSFVVIDVREPWEYDTANIPDTDLVPLNTLPSAINRFDREAHYVVLCHHGTRSAMAANWMRAQGFPHVLNLTGGIDAWSLDVDRTVPRY